MRQDMCADQYKFKTFDGKILPTAANLKQINTKCASVTNNPLLIEHPKKQTGEPLHVSAGMIHHFLSNARANIRQLESEDTFISEMHGTLKEVSMKLDQVATTAPPSRKMMIASTH